MHSSPIKRLPLRYCVTLAVLTASLGVAGCQFSDRLTGSLHSSIDSAGTDGQGQADAPFAARHGAADDPADNRLPTGSRDDVRPVLAQPTWFVRIEARDTANPVHQPRWRHPGLEDLLARPVDLRPNFASWDNDPDPIVAGNAAIAQARLGGGRGAARLAATVRRPELKLAMRRAAVEALGELPAAQSVPELRALLEQYGRRSSRTGSSELPELHAELLEAFARLAPADCRLQLRAACRSSSVAVRLAAVRGWPVERGAPLPQEVAAACGDADPRVRVAAMERIVAQRPANVDALIERGLQDESLTVRLTAVRGLGQVADRPARKAAVGLLANRNEMVRAAAVTALAQMGAGDEMTTAATDKSSRVRRAVATSLGRTPAAAGQDVARQLVLDPNRGVADAMIAAVAQWPLDRAGPVLLAGLSAQSFAVRHAAAAQLASRWPAVEMSVDELASRDADLLKSLDDRWSASWASPQSLPAAVYRELPPQVDSSLETLALASLQLPDRDQRRKAAQALADQTRDGPLSSLALRRLERLVVPEADVGVWWNVELALADDLRPAAVRIHLAALSHPGPEIRRRACLYLARLGDPRHADALRATLDDSNSGVVHAAVVALGQIGAGPAEQARQRQALEGLLVRRDPWLRLAVAEALAKLGYPSGPAALERLAYDGDPKIRRQVAEKMGQLGRQSFVPALVRLLDDRQDVRKTALSSLQEIAPHAVAAAADGSPRTIDQQVSGWKLWYTDQ